jgi:hypothetical protein
MNIKIGDVRMTSTWACALKRMTIKHIDLWIIHTQLTNPDTLPSSLIDSNVSLKWKQQKSKESGARSLAHNT